MKTSSSSRKLSTDMSSWTIKVWTNHSWAEQTIFWQRTVARINSKFTCMFYRTQTGGEYAAVVEFSPFQKIPKKKPKKPDSKKGTIEEGTALSQLVLHREKKRTRVDQPGSALILVSSRVFVDESNRVGFIYPGVPKQPSWVCLPPKNTISLLHPQMNSTWFLYPPPECVWPMWTKFGGFTPDPTRLLLKRAETGRKFEWHATDFLPKKIVVLWFVDAFELCLIQDQCACTLSDRRLKIYISRQRLQQVLGATGKPRNSSSSHARILLGRNRATRERQGWSFVLSSTSTHYQEKCKNDVCIVEDRDKWLVSLSSGVFCPFWRSGALSSGQVSRYTETQAFAQTLFLCSGHLAPENGAQLRWFHNWTVLFADSKGPRQTTPLLDYIKRKKEDKRVAIQVRKRFNFLIQTVHEQCGRVVAHCTKSLQILSSVKLHSDIFASFSSRTTDSTLQR